MSPWETLVREHLPVVTGVALRILGDRAAAEDVAQDLFLHLLQNPRALDGAGNVRSFLCRAAINRALDRIRERERRERREAAFPQAPRDLDPLSSAAHEEIRRSVEALPRAERDAVAARFFRGLTVREAAAEMRVSVGTVCNRLETGLKRLRRWLGAASFVVLCGVLEDEAVAAGDTGGLAERVVSRRREMGDGRWETGVGRGKGRGKWGVAAAGAMAAAVLISIWMRQALETEGGEGDRVEIAAQDEARRAAEGGPAAETAARGREAAASPAGRAAGRARGELFRAEGFLVADGDGYRLVEPAVREPRKVDGPATGETLLAAGPSFCLLPGEDFTGARRAFRLARSPELDRMPAGTVADFTSWLDGLDGAAALPRARLVVRAAWVDEAAGLAEAVEIEEAEVLGDAWLAAWRDALRANAALREAFDLPPGPRRRADALAAAGELAAALQRARDARRGESAAAWRVRRESEVEIASAGALACLGLEEEFPEGPEEAGDLEAARAAGLELEHLPQVARGALALRGGARIVAVAPGSAADRAGLRAGDIVWRMTPLAGAGRSAPRDILRPADVAALFEDLLESGGSGLEFEIVRGLDALVVRVDL